MREEIDELDLLLAWPMRELFPEEEPSPYVWEAIRTRLDTLEADRREGGRALGYPRWVARVGGWLGVVHSLTRMAFIFLLSRLEEMQIWAQERPTPASVVVCTYAGPWSLYSYREATLHCWWSLTPALR